MLNVFQQLASTIHPAVNMENVFLQTSVDATQNTQEQDVKHVRLSINIVWFLRRTNYCILFLFFQQFALAILPAVNMENVLLRTSVDATQNTQEQDVKHVRLSTNIVWFLRRTIAFKSGFVSHYDLLSLFSGFTIVFQGLIHVGCPVHSLSIKFDQIFKLQLIAS